jgi:hypothetical protein
LEAKKKSEAKDAASHQLKCVIGGEKCLYKDKAGLISGKITNYAKKQFKNGTPVVLPANNMLIDTTTVNSSDIIIDEHQVTDKDGKLDIDNLLNNKMEEDIKQ